MKKSIVYLIHTAFWFAYFLLLLVIIAAATQGFSSGPNFEKILKVVIPFVVIPSFSVFYVFYLYLFPKYIKTRKIGLSFVYGILFSIGSAFVGGLFLTILFGKAFMMEKGCTSFFFIYIWIQFIYFFNYKLFIVDSSKIFYASVGASFTYFNYF